MNYPDWMEYLSGSMSPADKADTERLLAENESARLEFAAFQEYRATLRQAVNAEGLPTARLEAMLSRSKPRRIFPRAAGLLAIAATAFAVVYFAPKLLNPDPVSGAVSRIDQIARLQTSDPGEASRWVNKNVSFRVPTYRLSGIAHMTGAECGDGWGAYLFDCGNKKARIVIRPKSYEFKGSKPVVMGHTTFYVGKSVGWKCNTCAYEVVGCDEETQLKIAKAAATELFGRL